MTHKSNFVSVCRSVVSMLVFDYARPSFKAIGDCAVTKNKLSLETL